MKTVHRWFNKAVAFGIVLGFVCWVSPAHATIGIEKAYKKVFEGAKVQCMDCHTDKLPKKEEGQHENNAYGKELLKEAAKDKVTEDVIKKVGSIEDFAKKAAEQEK